MARHRSRRWKLVLPIACAALLACSQRERPAATAAGDGASRPAAATTPAPPATGAHPAPDSAAGTSTAPASSPMPGDLPAQLSEEQFKALHEVPQDAPRGPLRGSRVEFEGRRAYLSLPAVTVPGETPGIVVIHEWWGMNQNMLHWTDRLAAEGYAALAVDLYNGRMASTPDQALAFMEAVNDEEALATLLAAHRFLVQDSRVRAPRTASIGWCFGGGWSLHLAMNEPELDAAVIYYGRLVNDVEQLKSIRASVLGIFGTKDASIPAADVEAFDAALTQAGVEHRILSYEADHAFANPSAQGRYDQPSAAAAWDEVRKFLEEELKSPAPR